MSLEISFPLTPHHVVESQIYMKEQMLCLVIVVCLTVFHHRSCQRKKLNYILKFDLFTKQKEKNHIFRAFLDLFATFAGLVTG